MRNDFHATEFFSIGKNLLQIIESGEGLVESLAAFQALVEKWTPDIAAMAAAERGNGKVMHQNDAAARDKPLPVRRCTSDSLSQLATEMVTVVMMMIMLMMIIMKTAIVDIMMMVMMYWRW